MAERRAHQPQQQIEHAEAEHGDDDVIVQRIVEAERPDAAALQAAEAVLAAGHRGPAEGDGVGQRRQRQRQQREIDAAPAQDDEADEGRDDGDDDRRQQQRQQDVVAEPVALDQPRRIGADAEPGAVAERDQAGVADAEIEPHRGDRERHHHGAGVERQADQIQRERQRDDGKRGQPAAADIWRRSWLVIRTSRYVRRAARAGAPAAPETSARRSRLHRRPGRNGW